MKRLLSVNRLKPFDSPFPPAYVTYIPHRKMWRMVADYQVEVSDVTFLIPIDFEFDLASVPRIIWPIISSFELSIVAPLLHDYHYAFKGIPVYHSPGITYTRKEADDMFYRVMLTEGIPTWKAKAAYRAVRMFGPRWK